MQYIACVYREQLLLAAFEAQSFQSQTCAKKCAMLTFLVFISTIHGCSSIRHGVARLAGSFSRLDGGGLCVSKKPWRPITRHQTGYNSRALNEVFESLTPFNPMLLFIFQLRNRLPHNISQQINQPCPRLHLRPIGRERKPVLRDFEQGDAQGPDVGGDGVGLAGDALGGHVVGGADEGVGVAFGAEFAADAEVAELDLTVAAEEDVGGFDVCCSSSVEGSGVWVYRTTHPCG